MTRRERPHRSMKLTTQPLVEARAVAAPARVSMTARQLMLGQATPTPMHEWQSGVTVGALHRVNLSQAFTAQVRHCRQCS
jgi:hypothetical protein